MTVNPLESQQIRAQLLELDSHVSRLRNETSTHQQSTRKTYNKIKNFTTQMSIIKDGITQLSEAMLEEFALIR